MTDEHKARLAEGRRLAREAKAERQREAATRGREGGASRTGAPGPPPAAAAALPPPQVVVTGNLKPGGVPTADTLEQIARIVKTYHAAGLGKGKPFEEMLGLAVRGWEIGIPPGEAIAGLYRSAEGGEAMSGELMRSQVHRSGVGHIEVVQSTHEVCVLKGIRRGWEDRTQSWTLADARRAGLGGESWEKYPRQMLFNRATSELCRVMFSDVLMGVSYTPEEIGVKAAPVGGEGAGSASRGSAPAGAAPSAAVTPSTSGGSPVEAPSVAQEASGGQSLPQGTPPSSGVSPSPSNGGKHPERALSVPVKIPTPGDASNLREVLTAGITAEQIAMLQGMTGKTGGYPDWQEKQARARAYFAKWNLPVDLRYLTKDEADGLIAELSSTMPVVEEHGPAEKLLDAVIRKYDLEEYRTQIVEAALSRFQVLTLGEMTVDQGKILASQLAAMAQDKQVFPLLLAGMKQQEGVG